MTEAICRSILEPLEFREGIRFTFVDPRNRQITAPAFMTADEAEAWHAPFLEAEEAKRAAEEAAKRKIEDGGE